MVPKWVHDRLDALSEGMVHGKVIFNFQDGKVVSTERTETERERYKEVKSEKERIT
jgi:hypothetical protein